MRTLRTPDARFVDLPGFPLAPRYADVPDGDGGTLRMAWVEDGPADGPVVLLLHGEPSWSFLHRTMIPVLAAAGLRAVAPDLVGFGRSDKPTEPGDHTYARHVEWVRALVFDVLDLHDVTLVGQDWGGLIGLRLVGEHPARFARVVAANTGLPTGDHDMPEVWWQFRRAVEKADVLDVGRLVQSGCRTPLTPEIRAAYDAPFPDESYKEGARQFPLLVPTSDDDQGAAGMRAVADALSQWDKPALVAFSDTDPVFPFPKAGEQFTELIPTAGDQVRIEGAAHFLQEDRGVQIADAMLEAFGQP